jgi:hypothetical protein
MIWHASQQLAPRRPLAPSAQRLRRHGGGVGIGGPDAWHGPVGFAAVACIVSAGLVLVAVGDGVARDGSGLGTPLFWAGMFTIWTPIALLVLGAAALRSERVALLLLLGLALYVVNVLYSPRYFGGHDEFLHWRTAQDILQNRDLFSPNPVLPVSPLYPGLELATTALASMSGLSVHVSGLLVIAAARIMMIVALFLLYETVGHSARLAGIAVLVYMTNPHFLFFDGSFAYESLALPFALIVLYGLARAQVGQVPAGLLTLTVLSLAATAVTHHVTSFILVIVLLLVAAIAHVVPGSWSRRWNWGIALFGVGLVLFWLAFVATEVLGYLEPTLGRGVGQVFNLISGEGASRKLFHGGAGQPTSPLDRVASLAFTAVTLLGLAYGLICVLRRARLISVFTVVFGLTALAYPASGLFRLTEAGAELGDRIAPFVFVPVGFFVAAAVAAIARHPPSPKRIPIVAAATAALLYGGVAIAAPAWDRLPGPYLVSADSHSVEPEGISDAEWTRRFLGPENRVVADRVNRLLMLTYGRQFPVTELSAGINTSEIFFRRRLDDYTTRLLGQQRVRYVVVDRRLSQALPQVGVYVDAGEPGALDRTRPIPLAALTKFNRARRISRVLDSGHISIYDVRGVAR